MDSSPTEKVMDHRRGNIDDTEPLFSDIRRVQKRNEATYAVNIMSEFRKMANITKGDEVIVEAYEDRYVVRPANE